MKFDFSSIRIFRWPLFLAGLTAVAGIGLSVYLRNRIAQTEADTARLAAETLRLNTEQELNLFSDVLESVCALHALSDAVDQAAMDEFISKGLVHQHTVLGTFGLTQQISPWLRREIEGKEKNQPGAYQVVQRGPDGTWIPAESRPVYYPLTWESRPDGLNVPIGFDFASLGEAARQTIGKIEQTRRPALDPSPISWDQRSEVSDQKSDLVIAPPPLISDLRSQTSDFPSYWVFAPVMPGPRKDSILYFPPNSVIGFAVAVLHPEAILKRVAALASPAAVLRMTLQPAPPDSAPEETIRRMKGGWLYRHSLEAINTQWVFECTMPVTVSGNRSAIALTIGLIITALMASQLLILGSRTEKIETEVRARTEDLRIANARLEKNFHERARLEEEMNELAARERRKIGRDLHDSLGQKLTGAVFLSRSLLNHFSNSKDQESGVRSQGSDTPNPQSSIINHQSLARTLNETLKDAVAQVRSMARGLDPVTLSNESLCDALGQLAEEMTGLYGVSCEVTECIPLPSLDRKHKEQLYLIAREAVNNAARHAQAGRVTIRLSGNDTRWTLRVEDDGKGLPAAQTEEGTHPAGGGMGIRIMRHRASLIGASFSITSAPGRGTSVEITGQM